jgi:Tfp pilus assembly protein PilV
MSRRFRSRYRLRGFTLMEAMVSLIILVVVMVVTLSLMFSMSSFAERQQTRLAPRQTSRQAIDYLGFYVQGAADMNPLRNDPNAIVTWTIAASGNTANTVAQVAYNNLTAAQSALNFGDVGTDIVTLAVPVDPLSIPVAVWPGLQHAATLWFDYAEGCPDDTTNMNKFQQATGAINAGTTSAYSPLLTLVDSMGNWVYYQITSYQSDGKCSNLGGSNAIIHVVMTPGQSAINIPSGHPDLVQPVSMAAGVAYTCFRVKGGNLQQKQGFFDPANPDAGFSSILEDVEDLQVAYLYGAAPDATKPTIYTYNTSTDAIPATVGGVATNGVPPQAGLLVTGAPTAWDITNVQGLRVSITSRSKALRFTSLKLSQRVAETINNFRPAAEDRAKGAVDGFDHNRVTTTLMIRNRMLGG